VNIFVYSENKEITEHFVNEFSSTEYSVNYFSSLESLVTTIENEAIVNLIYHLGVYVDESELVSLQQRYKEKLNTLVLTNTPYPEQGVRLLGHNIRGYANSYLEHDKLMTAVAVIQQGEVWAGSSLIHYMLTRAAAMFAEAPAEEEEYNNHLVFDMLTSREQQIAQKILLGLQNKVIADKLSITERTVKAHLSTIYKKLSVRNRLELTLKLQQADRRSLS